MVWKEEQGRVAYGGVVGYIVVGDYNKQSLLDHDSEPSETPGKNASEREKG